MNFFKNIWNKIKNPHGVWYALFVIFFVLAVAGTIVLVVLSPNQTVFHFILYFLSALSLSYFVYSIIILAPKIKNNIIVLLKKYKFTNSLLSDYGYRTTIFSLFGYAINLSYVIFVGVFAFISMSPWYISITAIYLVFIIVKTNVYIRQKKNKNDFEMQAKTYRYSGIMFIFLTLALSGVIVLIYTSNMYFEYAGLLIYVFATFTFYKLTLAIYNIFKAKKHNNYYIQSIRNLNLASALFSIVVLQVALFQAFSPQDNTSIANALTGAGVSIVLLCFGIYMIVKSNKILKTIKDSSKNLDNDINNKNIKMSEEL